MVNATTFSNPKEMLGYMIIQDFAHITEVTKLIYYDRKAALTVTALLGTLDAKMTPFHNEMFYNSYDEQKDETTKMDYNKAKAHIEAHLKEAANMLYERNYESYIKGILMWETLIASSFPRLGLVPETHETSKEEGLVDEGEENYVEPGVTIESDPEDIVSDDDRDDPIIKLK